MSVLDLPLKPSAEVLAILRRIHADAEALARSMAPDNPQRDVVTARVYDIQKGMKDILNVFAAAIRAAENDALERAALSVDAAFPGDYGGKRIRAMKHRN